MMCQKAYQIKKLLRTPEDFFDKGKEYKLAQKVTDKKKLVEEYDNLAKEAESELKNSNINSVCFWYNDPMLEETQKLIKKYLQEENNERNKKKW